MNYKSIFNAGAVVTVLTLTGCTTPSMTYEQAPTPPPPPPRASTPPTVYQPPVKYDIQNDTIAEEKTVVDEDKYIGLTPKFLTTSTIADLEVSDKRVTGSATGPFAAKDILEREAVAKALIQKDGSDVLVGFTFFYKTSSVRVRSTASIGRNSTVSEKNYVTESYLTEPYLTVTVTGYPARYVNFRTYNSEINSNSDRSNAAHKSGTVAPPVIVPSTGASGEQSIFKGGLR